MGEIKHLELRPAVLWTRVTWS